jgi:hypothetical protein
LPLHLVGKAVIRLVSCRVENLPFYKVSLL